MKILLDELDPAACAAARAAWPALDWPGWTVRYDTALERKAACNDWRAMPEPCRRLLAQLLFLDVSAFGGPLVPDLGLWGGGMQTMGPGGSLDLHLDADTHAQAGLARRLNAVLFLNDGWRKEWGGHLEFWDANRTEPVLRVLPSAGRLVLFETTAQSYHRVACVSCPAGEQRRSLACWWYGPADGAGARPRARFVAAASENDPARDALRAARAAP